MEAKLRAAVVDDDRLMRELVRGILEERGYVVFEAETGAAGLRIAQAPLDVMVLDLQLPDLNGLAVWHALRGSGFSVPVVFLTASSDEHTIVSCLAAGTTDYLGKPFQPAELLARIDGVMRARRAESERLRAVAQLEAAYSSLRDARGEALLHHHLHGLAVVATGLAHEMNSPLGALLASLQFALRETDEKEREAALKDALSASERIVQLVARMQKIAGTEDATEPIELRSTCREVCASFTNTTASVLVTGSGDVHVLGVRNEVRVLLSALIENALQATEVAGAKARVEIGVDFEGPAAVVTVDDNGPGIDPNDLPFVFDPFFTKKRVWSTAGLGLTIAQAAARRHAGAVAIEGRGPLGGARALVRLPLLGNAAGRAEARMASLTTTRTRS